MLFRNQILIFFFKSYLNVYNICEMKWREKQRYQNKIKRVISFLFIVGILLTIACLKRWLSADLHIYWINMDNAIDRRQTMIKHLEGVNHPETRIPAVGINYVKQHWDQIKHEGVTGYDPLPTTNSWLNHVKHDKYMYVEFAVTLSHIRAIRQAYKDGYQYALILEDDARITNTFLSEWRHFIQMAPVGWHMLNLYTTNMKSVMHLNALKDPFVKWKAYFWGATAYILNREGIIQILDTFEKKMFTEKMVVVDEIIATMAGKTYQCTHPLITISGAISTQQVSIKNLMDKTFGTRINKLLRAKRFSDELYSSSSYKTLIVSETCSWHASKAVCGPDLVSDYDYVLFKNNALTLDGFAWQTFVQFMTNFTIIGAFPVSDESFNSRTWQSSRPTSVFDFRTWIAIKNYGAFANFRPIPFDVIPKTFALVNASFLEWYLSKNKLEPEDWCGAAFQWAGKHSCAMIPLAVDQRSDIFVSKRPTSNTKTIMPAVLKYSYKFTNTKLMSHYWRQVKNGNEYPDFSFYNKCNMIIAAGMPRTGSTWFYTMIRAIILAFGRKIAFSSYWKAPERLKYSPGRTQNFYNRENVAWANYGPNDFFIYKSHEFKPDLANRCENTLIFTSNRYIDKIALSKLNAVWLSDPLAAIKGTRQDVITFHKWKAHGAIVYNYDTAIINKTETLLSLEQNIAKKFGILTQPNNIDLMKMLHQEANPQIRGSSKWKLSNITYEVMVGKLLFGDCHLYSPNPTSNIHNMLDWAVNVRADSLLPVPNDHKPMMIEFIGKDQNYTEISLVKPRIIWLVNEIIIPDGELVKQFKLLDETLRPGDFVFFEKMINKTNFLGSKDELILRASAHYNKNSFWNFS